MPTLASHINPDQVLRIQVLILEHCSTDAHDAGQAEQQLQLVSVAKVVSYVICYRL